MKKLGLILLVLALSLVAAIPAFAGSDERGSGPVIFVESQGLYFDSIVTADPLPVNGPFQELFIAENGLTTAVGPGDPGYVGGRWWMDSNDNGVQDRDDHYFECPLLGPGREMP